ncbi:hypothetical protein ACLMJK_008686 [Lecanora helva]
MDPITAIGLASAITTFVSIGASIVIRVKELSEAGDAPAVFRTIETRLSLLMSLVGQIQSEIDHLTSEEEKTLKKALTQCFDQANQLEEILKKVTVTKNDSRWKKLVKATTSLLEEKRAQAIAAALKDDVHVLTFLRTTPTEKTRPKVERHPSEPLPSYVGATGLFLVPFSRDKRFVGREGILKSIASCFETQNRVAISGIGGVGKSQIAIEYCYRYKKNHPNAHTLWVYGGNIARFYQGYKRIAQLLQVPGWEDPEASILELVCSWLSDTQTPYLLVIDNADNIEEWFPGKYKSGGSLDDPSNDLSKYIPSNGNILITTRNNSVAGRLAQESKPLAVEPMTKEEARCLFLAKLGEKGTTVNTDEIRILLERLDHLPLALSQAAAFIEENPTSVAEYSQALQGNDTEEFLDYELNDPRRDAESKNSAFRTWNLSYQQIKDQRPRAADLLCLLSMFDRQSIPKSLLKVPEVTTSLGVLQSFNLISSRAGSQSFSMHRLVQRFVQLSLERENTIHKWQEAALAYLARDYPTVIGVAEWPFCDTLAPHVHVVTSYVYTSKEARLNLAYLLCWAADFDIERGLYTQALQRAEKSLRIFQELVSKDDERLASATWLYGRLRYYQVQSASDIEAAAELLETALSISEYPSLNFAESAFELAHLYYDQCNEDRCLEMGKASFECWEKMEGRDSVRTLDNMHDYALELAMLGHSEEGIKMWQEIVDRCPASDASDQTKEVYKYRSMAGIAEFRGDAATAEVFYAKLIALGEVMYHAEHIHLFDYRLSHAEQVMRQGRLEEAVALSEAILATAVNTSEWRITASCLQTISECHRLGARYYKEEEFRRRTLELHEKMLGDDHKDTIDAKEALADCYLNVSNHLEAKDVYQQVLAWRKRELHLRHSDTLRAIECLAICHAYQGQESAAGGAYLDAIDRQEGIDPRFLYNHCISLRKQSKWQALEQRSRQICAFDSMYRLNAHQYLLLALEQQGKADEALEAQVAFSALEEEPDAIPMERMDILIMPPARDDRRFGRMVHPRTWSA